MVFFFFLVVVVVVVVVVYVKAEIASGKYVLSSGGMIGSRALHLITQFVVFQGLIDVALKTCGIATKFFGNTNLLPQILLQRFT